MASTSAANADPPRNQFLSVSDFLDDQSNAAAFSSMNMDDLLKNFYANDSDSFPTGGPAAVKTAGVGENRTADEVWREIVTGGSGISRAPEMTLEDFLTKAGAVTEEDVRVPAMLPPPGFGVDVMMSAPSAQFHAPVHMQPLQQGQTGGFGNGMDCSMVAAVGGSRVGRGKRRMVVEEPPLDKATEQKQRRMIKNRVSAARSRERKQAYTVELESLVTQLEEENAGLLREEAQQNKERFKKLVENLIPVAEKRKPPRVLQRVHSMSW